jgi:hypothetical protein
LLQLSHKAKAVHKGNHICVQELFVLIAEFFSLTTLYVRQAIYFRKIRLFVCIFIRGKIGQEKWGRKWGRKMRQENGAGKWDRKMGAVKVGQENGAGKWERKMGQDNG